MEVLLSRRAGNPTLKTPLLALICYCVSLLSAPRCWGQQESADTAQPYFKLRSQQTQYVGPADKQTEAGQVAEVRVGYFGPSDPHDPAAGQMWCAAQLAIDDANRDGGFRGVPFRLLPAWSADPWGTGVKQLTRLVFEDHVWAIVGGIDGPTTHLAEQVVAKAMLPLVSPASTDKTVNLANVPWMFSLAPRDDLIAAALAPRIAEAAAGGTFVVVTANDHDSYLLTRELRAELARRKLVPAFQFEFRPGTDRLEDLTQAALASQPRVIVAVANADVSVQVVRDLRQQQFTGLIVGGPGFARAGFRNQIGDAAGQLMAPVLTGAAATRVAPVDGSPAHTSSALPHYLPDHPLPGEFDFAALQTYDAVRITIEAIRKAGLSRVEIGRALRELSPCYGTSGLIQWDGLGSNMRLPTVEMLGAEAQAERTPNARGSRQ